MVTVASVPCSACVPTHGVLLTDGGTAGLRGGPYTLGSVPQGLLWPLSSVQVAGLLSGAPYPAPSG